MDLPSRVSERLNSELFIQSVKIKLNDGSILNDGYVIDISYTGIGILFERETDFTLDDSVRLEIIISNNTKIRFDAVVKRTSQNSIVGFEIKNFHDSKEVFFDLIDKIYIKKAELKKSPPKKWNISEEHFSEAIQNPWYNLLFKLYADIYKSTNTFFDEKKYLAALMPITCGSVSSPMGLGSDSLPVQIQLFDEQVYLADSMQFHLEYLLRHKVPGVYYIMPTFRGEDPDDRHLNQFMHSEAEITGGLNDVMEVVEEYVAFLVNSILTNHEDDIKKLCGPDLSHLKHFMRIAGKIPRITYEEAFEMLGSDESYISTLQGGFKTISSKGEKELMKRLGGYVWLTHPPYEVVPFYQAYSQDNKHALSADLLMGIGETVGCGERHVGEDQTLKSLQDHEVDENEYSWYLRLKREYPMKTAGFGMGVERFLLWVLDHDDIRDIPIISRLKGIRSLP